MSDNFEKLKNIISYFAKDSRVGKIRTLVESYGVDRITSAPFGHKVPEYAGVYNGGWLDFVNLFIVNSITYKRNLENAGEVSFDFSDEEVLFSCFFSCIHKLGHPDKTPMYLPQTNEWRRNNLGEYYTYNQGYTQTPDFQNFQICNDYNIKLSNYELTGVFGFNSFSTHSGYHSVVKGTFSSNISFILSTNYIKTILDLKTLNKDDD